MIFPIVLVVVFLILAMLLRAVLLPLLLIATVIASYAAALGTGAVRPNEGRLARDSAVDATPTARR